MSVRLRIGAGGVVGEGSEGLRTSAGEGEGEREGSGGEKAGWERR